MSTKEIKNNTASTLRGIKKFYLVAVGVVEALSWLGLVGLGFATVWCTLKNEAISINDIGLYYIGLSTIVIGLRLVYEGAKYFRDLGDTYEH